MNQKGSLFGGILLVAGCSIGAGMLGLPVVSALAGFGPSILMCFLTWGYMCATGLLLLEATLWYKDEVNIVTVAGRTLGAAGRGAAWFLFLYLFYSLLVAYIAGSGSLFSDFTRLPRWVGSVLFTTLYAFVIYCGTLFVDQFNRLLMTGLFVAYVLLVVVGLPHVNPHYLTYTDWSSAGIVLSVMVLMFGYHNLVPSLCTYLNRDARRLTKTIVIGSALPLIVYVIWEALILGLIPVDGEFGFRAAANQGEMATHALREAAGATWVVDLAGWFAFFAIVTSLLSVALSCVDFLADGLGIKKTPNGKTFLIGLVLIPPFLFSLAYPHIFLFALEYAGGIGAVTLFGIMPALIVWIGRYWEKIEGVRILPGGRLSLIAVMLFSFVVMGFLIQQKVSP